MHPATHSTRLRAASLLGAVAVAVSGCAQDLHQGAWDDLVSARQQDAIDRGWVPDWLPEAATDLVQVNRPMTGEVVVRADLPADEWLDGCNPVDERTTAPDLADWWQPPASGDPLACPGDCPEPPDDGPCGETWHALRGEGRIWAWRTDLRTD